VYDVVTGKDTFAKTTREIAEYVGREFDDAGEFRTGMVAMRLPDLTEPVAPADNAGVVAVELWKLARRTYEKSLEVRRKNSARVFALLIGQCSQALRNRLEAHEHYSRVNATSNVIRLLEMIQGCMIQRQTRQKPVHTALNAEDQVHAFRQRNLPNNEYYDKFKDLINNAERLGREFGAHPDRVDAHLAEIVADPDFPTADEHDQARERARDEYLAVMFLTHSDKHRYGNLIRDIENEYTRGSDTYPTSLNAAYDYLVNYRADKPTRHDGDDDGLAFYNQDEDTMDSGRGRGHGGRGAG